MIHADEKQIIGEVKERNRFYKTIVELRERALSASNADQYTPNQYKEIFLQMIDRCDKALEGVM